MKARFNGRLGLDVDMAILGLTQRHGESCASYFTRILNVTTGKNIPESMLTTLALKGPHSNLKTIVMPQAHTTLEALRKASMLAERTGATTMIPPSVNNMEEMTSAVINAMKDQFSDVMTFNRDKPPQQTNWSTRPAQKPEGPGQPTNGYGEQKVTCRNCKVSFFWFSFLWSTWCQL